MKKGLFLLLMILVLFGCTSETTSTDVSVDVWRNASEVIEAEDDLGITPTYVVITIQDIDNDAQPEVMRVRLFTTVAPITVNNFVNLANQNFYNGLTMHRIIKDFMIQGGNPELKGRDSATSITGEFQSNNVFNDLKHTRGVISMARTDEVNSAASQFFIVHENYPSLNGNYAAFGVLADDASYLILDKIANVETNSSDEPSLAEIIITSIVVE